MVIVWKYARCFPSALHFTCVWLVRMFSVEWTMKLFAVLLRNVRSLVLCRTILLAAPIPFGSSRHASLLWQVSKLSVVPRETPPPFFCIQFFFNVSRKIVLYCLTIYLLYTEQQLSFKHILVQKCTNPGRWVLLATKFPTFAPNICGFTVWNLSRVTNLPNFEVDFSYLKTLRPVVSLF